MKNLITRTLAGTVFVSLVIGSILYHPIAVFIVFFVFNMLALFEFVRMFKNQSTAMQASSVLFMGSLVYALIGSYANGWVEAKMLYAIMPLVFIGFVSALFQKIDKPFENLGIKVIALLYISIPFGLFNIVANMGLLGANKTEPILLIGFFVLVWSSDTFAYLSGMAFGKHRLFERISPKKSWEGSIGGAIATMIIAWLMGYFSGIFTPWTWLVMALFIAITATLGDLVESMLKRQTKVKDSGSIMPGHGGILDRFDAAIFSIPFYVFLLYLLA